MTESKPATLEKLVQVAAALHLLRGGLALLVTVLMMLLAKVAGVEAPAESWMSRASLAMSIPHLISGYGMLRREAWARPFGIVAAVTMLVLPPLGTLIGAYTLAVLFLPGVAGFFGRAESAE